MSMSYDELYQALLEIVGFLNRPQEDNILLSRADVSLDTALLPLLMRISLQGPIGIVELADLVSRNYTTVSRQVAKLEARGLISSHILAEDQRMRQVTVTSAGQQMVVQIAETRNRMMDEVLHDWDERSKAELTHLVRKLASSLQTYSQSRDEG